MPLCALQTEQARRRGGNLFDVTRLLMTRCRQVPTCRPIPKFRLKCMWNKKLALKALMEHLRAQGLLAMRMPTN